MVDPASNQLAPIGLIWLFVLAIIYFVPAINAYSRGHRQRAVILVTNLFLGWTLLGWALAFAWSFGSARDDPAGPTPETHVKCPDCRELIRRDARKCRYCGCRLSPQ